MSKATAALWAAAGLGIFVVAYRRASYGVVSRAETGILLAWLFVCICAFGVRRVPWRSRAFVCVGGALCGLAVWTGLSITWATDRDAAFWAFGLVTLYVAAYAVAATAFVPANLVAICDVTLASLAAVAVVALVSRCFPGVFPSAASQLTALPGSEYRLSFPIGYWNGLGYFVAAGVPLALRPAVTGRAPLVARIAAMAFLPVAEAVFYLSSSRGATLAAALGCVAFVVLAGDRWLAAVAAVACGAAGALVVAVWLHHESALAQSPGTALARSQGLPTALVIAGAALAAALLYAAAWDAFLRRLRPGRNAALAAAALAVVCLAAFLVVVDAPSRFESFKAVPEPGGQADTHYLSGGGTGRWQVWTSAVDEFRTAPVQGRGAGSFTAWWAEHGQLGLFIQNAHSLYLETLGELGLVGFALLLVAIGGGIGIGCARAFRFPPATLQRTRTAAPVAALVVFAASAAIDWTWQLPANGIVAMLMLGLVTGSATALPARSPEPAAPRGLSPRRAGLAAAALVAALIAGLQLYQLVIQLRIDASRSAASASDGPAALHDAAAARALAPWLATPNLQIALVEERFGSLAAAEAAVQDALDRSPNDWRIWLTAARIQAERGKERAAAASVGRARQLNPRSPIFEP